MEKLTINRACTSGKFIDLIYYKKAQTDIELQEILQLQQANLSDRLTTEEKQLQGFVTLTHTLQQLQKLNAIEPHIIAVDEDDVVIGYLLTQTSLSKNIMPELIHMFDLFATLTWQGKPVAEYNYMVVGQVCMEKKYRGKGILMQCYNNFKNAFQPRYDFAITEIAANNQRSLHAHFRIGFTLLHTYSTKDGTTWCVVIWQW